MMSVNVRFIPDSVTLSFSVCYPASYSAFLRLTSHIVWWEFPHRGIEIYWLQISFTCIYNVSAFFSSSFSFFSSFLFFFSFLLLILLPLLFFLHIILRLLIWLQNIFSNIVGVNVTLSFSESLHLTLDIYVFKSTVFWLWISQFLILISSCALTILIWHWKAVNKQFIRR